MGPRTISTLRPLAVLSNALLTLALQYKTSVPNFLPLHPPSSLPCTDSRVYHPPSLTLPAMLPFSQQPLSVPLQYPNPSPLLVSGNVINWRTDEAPTHPVCHYHVYLQLPLYTRLRPCLCCEFIIPCLLHEPNLPNHSFVATLLNHVVKLLNSFLLQFKIKCVL